ncbi:MAG: GTPase Era [Hyphomicrobiaceae bacterium]
MPEATAGDHGERPAADGDPSPAGKERFGFVAVIGAPNAGKSTLVNALVGTKVTIVSHKVQTTRMRVRGIVMAGNSQLVLVDTPGIFAPKRRLDRAMVNAAWGGASEADVVVLIVDAGRGPGDYLDPILQKVAESPTPRILVLNKIDRVGSKADLLNLTQALNGRAKFDGVFMISALTGDGIGDLRRELAAIVPAGPWHFPAEDVSDLPMRMLAAEVTREKLFNRLHDELPYATTVETTAWRDLKDGSARIEQTIFVEREGQRKIVLGKAGQAIKQISSEARAELKEMLDRNVHLFVFVKVRSGWSENPEHYREMGLDFPKE